MRIIYFVLRTSVALYLFNVFKKDLKEIGAFTICILYLSASDSPGLSYYNLFITFILLSVAIIFKKNAYWRFYLSGVFCALAIQAVPTEICMLPVFFIILSAKDYMRKRNGEKLAKREVYLY